MTDETKRTEAEPPGRRRSINDLRAPLMLLYVFAFCGGRMAALPMWLILPVMAVVTTALALFFERKLIMELLRGGPLALLAGVGGAALVYLIYYGSLPLISGFSIEDSLAKGGAIPALFAQLVAFKTHAAALHPALVGLVGAVLLGAGEEIFWRGFVLTRLMLITRHSFAILISTALYAGLYAVLLGSLAAAAAAVTGFACALMTHRTRSILPAIVCHGLVWLVGTWIMPLY